MSINVVVGGEVSGAISGLLKVEKQLAQTGTAFTKLQSQVAAFGGGVNKFVSSAATSFSRLPSAVAPAAASISKITTSSSGATLAMINLGRVVQDAPFGFLGIANNLNPLLESFQRLKATTGTTGGALKALGKSLTGAGGIGFALSIASSLLLVFGDKLFGAGKKAKEAAEEIKKSNEAIASAAAADLVKLTSLVAVIQNVNTKQTERTQALKALNDEYSKYLPGLDKEKVSLDNIAASYDKIIDAILRQAVIKGLQEEIEKAVAKTAAAIVAAEKAQVKSRLESEKNAKAAANAETKQDKLAKGYAKTNRVVADGVISQQRATTEVVKSTDAFSNLDEKIKVLTENLKRELSPLFDIMKDFNLNDLKVDIKDDKSNDEIVNKIIARAKRLAGEIENIFVVPNFSAADSQAETLRKAQKFLDEFFSAKLTIRPNIRFGINDVTPPPEFIASATTMAQMFGKGFNDYFAGGIFDPSIIRAMWDEADSERAKNMGKSMAKAFNEGLSSTLSAGIAAIASGIGAAFAGGDILSAFQGFAEVIGSGLQTLGEQIISIGIAAILAKDALKTLFSNPFLAVAAGAALVAAGAALKTALGGGLSGRAAGGPVGANQPYVVGEAGRELFVPSTSGRIIPNNMLSSIQGSASQLIQVMVTGRIEGRDLALVEARQTRYTTRNA